jgi:hypothetical protein
MNRREAMKAAAAAIVAGITTPTHVGAKVYWDNTKNQAITLGHGMVVKLPKGWKPK